MNTVATSLDGPAVPPSLHYSLAEPRQMVNMMLTLGAWIVALAASVPLFSVLYMLVSMGGARLSLDLFTQLPPAGFEMGGGFGNAIVGTVTMVWLASVISIPVGIMAAVFLVEIAPESKTAEMTRFVSKILTGFPSILAGVFVYAAVVLVMGRYSALAGGLALAVLMLPTVVLTSAEALGMVPRKIKDAALGMGCTNSQMIIKVVLPTAAPGILTGVMLAVARVAGESAPLLFTALFSSYWLNSLGQPTASLSILIYNFSSMPFENQIQLAWTASLVLVLIVLAFNILSRLVGRPKV